MSLEGSRIFGAGAAQESGKPFPVWHLGGAAGRLPASAAMPCFPKRHGASPLSQGKQQTANVRENTVRRGITTRARALCAALGLATAVSVAIEAGAQETGSPEGQLTTVYRETFGFCTDTIGAAAAREANWWGFVTGQAVMKFSNLKVFSYGSRAIGGAVNSGPIGLSQGYGFWFRPTLGLTVFTQEYPFDASLLRDPTTVVEFEQRLSGINELLEPNRSHLAFLVDSTWYISAESAAQAKIVSWEAVAMKPASLSWGAVPSVEGVGPAAPATFDAVLPDAGTVRAFGIFLAEVNGRVRIDNFSIRSENPPGGAAQYMAVEPGIAACPEGSPDRTGMATPQPTPNPDENDGTPDQGTPETDPSPTPTPAPLTYSLCPAAQQGGGKQVQLSRSALPGMLKPIGKTLVKDLRDRAILALFAGRKMPIGALVNVLVGDYDRSGGTLAVKKKGKGGPVTLRLTASARKALDTYLAALGAVAPGAPLFVRSKARSTEVDSAAAACLPEVASMVRRRASKAKMPLSSLIF